MLQFKDFITNITDRLWTTTIFKFLKSYWMKGLIAAGCLYILAEKDIQIAFRLSDSKVQETSAVAFNEEGKKALQTTDQLSIVDPSVIQSILTVAKSIGQSDEEVVPKKNEHERLVVSNCSNVMFILDPEYGERSEVVKKEVEQKVNTCLRYLKRFAPVALIEEKKYGIPASIKLAQSLLASNAGDNLGAKKYNNHFGIKCTSKNCASGHSTILPSSIAGDGHKDFYRKFQTSWDSFRAHSLLLQREQYLHLQDIPIKDYRSWAKGLSETGYSNDPKYAEKLVRIIEAFDLATMPLGVE